jgi:hypothetical protein
MRNPRYGDMGRVQCKNWNKIVGKVPGKAQRRFPENKAPGGKAQGVRALGNKDQGNEVREDRVL